jgi:hypothetical protein
MPPSSTEPQASSKPRVFKKGKPLSKKTEKANAIVHIDESEDSEIETCGYGSVAEAVAEGYNEAMIKVNFDTEASNHFVKDAQL